MTLIVSGPLACFVHCEVANAGHHHAAGASHAGHQHAGYQPASTVSALISSHALLLINEHGDHALCDQVISQSSDVVPSALTIGVVLVASFVIPMLAVSLAHVDRNPQVRRMALPPPLAPPRSAPALA